MEFIKAGDLLFIALVSGVIYGAVWLANRGRKNDK